MNYAKDDLLFAPLGGSGEIGMNVNLYHYQDSWIMVDLGISFPDESTPGVDVILPDLEFIADRRDKLAGLVLTHGHEDHLGESPIYGANLVVQSMAAPLPSRCCGASLPSHAVILT